MNLPHTAAQKTQHTASLDELAEPNYYSNYLQTSSTGDFASHLNGWLCDGIGNKIPSSITALAAKSCGRLLIPPSASKLQVFQFIRESRLRSFLQTLAAAT